MFYVDYNTLFEMRRTFSTQSIVTFGTTSFNIFELMMFLNKRIATHYTFEKLPQKDDMSAFEGNAQADKGGDNDAEGQSQIETVSEIS